MVTANALSLLQAIQPAPWHDRWVTVLVVVACTVAVVLSTVYPFTWRALGIGLLCLLAAVAGLFARIAAGPRFYPRWDAALPVLRYPETLWVVRFLFVGGAVGVIAGFMLLLWRDAHDPETALTWRQVIRRLAVLAAITGLVWVALVIVHAWRN